MPSTTAPNIYMQDISLYKTMLEIRVFEESLCEYIENGTIKTPCHLYIGQEAVATGVCSNLNDSDYIWGNHRSHGHYIAKGGSRQSLMDEIFCKVTGCSKGRGGSMHIIDKQKGILGTVPIVAGTIPLAVGAALKFKLDREDKVSVAFLGDGATEEGHVIESMNIAALYDLPVLFVIENNLYSSHMHMQERRVQQDLQELGKSLGISSVKINGNDVQEVVETSQSIIGNIRSGNGPSIIECMTYRWRGHVGASFDEDVGVKRKNELAEWLAEDPIKREYERLLGLGIKKDELDNVALKVQSDSDQMIMNSLKSEFPSTSSLTDHVFS